MFYRPVCTLEIEFTGNSTSFKDYLLVGEESLPLIIQKLKGALIKTLVGHFYIQYLDDENDLISFDSEEEFKEFFKLAKQRCSDGKLLKLVVKCDQIPDQRKLTSQPEFQEIAAMVGPQPSHCPKETVEPRLGPTLASNLAEQCSYFSQWKMDFKSELKQEILQELRDQVGAAEEPNVLSNEVVANKEDPYSNLINLSGKRKGKLIHNLKKLEKKEKLVESEIEQRLEKLEMKKKKLLEKASVRAAYRNPIVDATVGLPFIMSGIATRDSVSLSKRVTVGKLFLHQWRVINDGTVPWKDVQLMHTWSSPGLEPDELILKCDSIVPGQEDQVTVKFRAPKVIGSFVTYWHFVHGPEMQQFGHYVSLTGNTKLPKQTCVSAAQTKVQGCKKRTKDEMKKVNFSEEMNFKSQADESTDAGVVYANEKSLASAEIAAEMAREAAKALLRRATEKQTDDDLSKKYYEALNLVDSASDTDAYMNDNEDTDPEFVIVNIPLTETSKATDKNTYTIIGDSTDEKKETNVMQNLKVDGNIILPPQIKATANDDINTNRVMEKETVVSKEVIENSETGRSCLYPEIPYLSHNSGLTEGQNNSSRLPDNPYQPLDLTNPAHVAVSYPLIHPMPPQRPSHSFQVFPPQSSSSHAIAFPPAPTNCFPASQISTTLSYTPIPNYSPETSSEKITCQPLVFPPPVTYEYPMAVPTTIHSPTPNSVYEYSFPAHQSSCDQFINKTTDQTPAHQEVIDVFTNFGPQTKTQTISSDGLSAAAKQNVGKATENPPSPNETATTEATTENPNRNDEASATIQILPQSLVDGAITVATTAYSTACNALNTFYTKEGEIQNFDPVFENNMALMLEMGFRNMERNARLLKRYKNDISQVITVICSSPAGDDLEID